MRFFSEKQKIITQYCSN